MKCPLNLSPDTFKRELITDPGEKAYWRGSLREGPRAELFRRKARKRMDNRGEGCITSPFSPDSLFCFLEGMGQSLSLPLYAEHSGPINPPKSLLFSSSPF